MFHGLNSYFVTSSDQRLWKCIRSKIDSQSVAKEHDRRHTMLFNMPQMERREESHDATFWRRLRDEPKEHLSAK